jgi:serine/threonine protein kinase
MVIISKKKYKITNNNILLFIPDYIKIKKKKFRLTSDISSPENIPRGAFGAVVFYQSYKNEYLAIKIINLSEMKKNENGDKKIFKSRKEAKIMKGMQKSFSEYCKKLVVKFIDNIEETIHKNRIQYIVMEKIDIDLKGFIKNEKYKSKKKKVSKSKTLKKTSNKSIVNINYNLNLVKRIIEQILQSLQCLHNKGIVYNDLKLSNILWDYKNKKIKLTDFNCIISKSEPEMTGCSTLTYRSPEQINHTSSNNNYKTDIWSVGVIMLSLLMKNNGSYFNIHGRNEIKNSITNFSINTIPDIIKSCMKNFKSFPKTKYNTIVDFLQKVLVQDFQKRLTAEECLKHPFFKNK